MQNTTLGLVGEISPGQSSGVSVNEGYSHSLDQYMICQGGTEFYQLPNPQKMCAFVAHYAFVKFISFCAIFWEGAKFHPSQSN